MDITRPQGHASGDIGRSERTIIKIGQHPITLKWYFDAGIAYTCGYNDAQEARQAARALAIDNNITDYVIEP